MLDGHSLFIHDELMKKDAYLNITQFLAGRDRFTTEEEIKTKAISKCRIHVAHAIERMNKYKVLSRGSASCFDSNADTISFWNWFFAELPAATCLL